MNRQGRQFRLLPVAILIAYQSPAPAPAACQLGKMAEIPVTMSDLRPLITAQINGEDARFIADSGAFYSMITEASAAEFKLRLTPAPFGLFIKGIGGTVDPSLATVKVFTIAGIPVHNVQFLVGGSTIPGQENVGVLGQNLFHIGDVEYDLGKGAIRLMHADGCGHAFLAYWVKPSEPYSVMDIEFATAASPHTTGTALINGAKIRVMFDSGAATSMLSQRAAERAGVKPDSEGVIDGGYSSGIGRGRIKNYFGRFASFKIGDEEIRNVRLRFGDIGLDSTDMLIGADFFLSHRIYVATSQRKLYFTYNGGAVFNLASSNTAPPHTASPNTAPSSPASSEPASDVPAQAKASGDELADAAAYARRGAAFESRHDYEHAIADLSRAIEMDAGNPAYFYQRGIAYRDNKQLDLAGADLNRALELKPDDLSALEARAWLRLAMGDRAGADADLDAADRAAPREADIRIFLARAYQSTDRLPASIAQYDLWIAAHATDSRMPDALNNRCWVRALQGQELDKALSDCNTALRLSVKGSNFSAAALDARGLVRLRLGDYDKSIDDYDASLKLRPKDAWALYGRGIDKYRKKKIPEGESDMAEAAKLEPKIAERFAGRGITP
jgi:tetratricopeptide (TPR) repeat protein